MAEQGTAGPALAVADHGGAQRWTMQLAPVNAINAVMLTAFEAALDAAEADHAVAAIVLDSGLKVFSAGADATWMAQTATKLGPQGLLEDFNVTMDRFRAVCLRLRQAPFLVIAALDEVAGKAGRIGVTCAKRAIFGAGELPLSAALPLDGVLHWDTMRRGNFLTGVEAFTQRYASGSAR